MREALHLPATESKEERFRILAAASTFLASSLDLDTTLHNAASALVPHIADWCVIDLAVANGAIEAVAYSHVDPGKIRWARELRQRYPMDPNAPAGAPQVIRTGRSEFYPVIDDALLQAVAKNQDELNLLRAVGYTSAVIVPLNVRGATIGAITLVMTDSGRHFSHDDVALAEEMARRCATAIDNARLFTEQQQSEARLRLALESGRMGAWDWDLSTNTEVWSPEMSEILGVPHVAVRPASDFFECVHPDDAPLIRERAARAMAEGREHVQDEFRVIRPDGAEIWVASRARVHCDAQGRAVRMTGVNMDITARKRAEEQVQLANERFRIAEDAANGFVYDWEVTKGTETRSENFTKVLGYSNAEIPDGGAMWESLIHPEDRPRVHEVTQSSFAAGAPGANVEYRIRHKDGRWLWVRDDFAVVRDRQGGLHRVVGSIVDITARKQVEERLRRLQEVTSSLAEAQTLPEVRQIMLGEMMRAVNAKAGALRLIVDDRLLLDTNTFERHIDREYIRRLEDLPLDARHPVAEAVRTGQPVFVPDGATLAQTYPMLTDFVAHGVTEASAHLPFMHLDRPFAVLSVYFAEPHVFEDAERDFILALADRAAVAYERARLFDAERRAKERAERLQALTARLATALTPAEVVQAVLDEGLPALESVAGSVVRLDGEDLVVVGTTGYPEEIVHPWRRFPLTVRAPLAEAVRTGEPIWIASRADYHQRYGDLLAGQTLVTSQAWMALPLVSFGRVLGALGLSYSTPQTFDSDRRRFAETLADLCAQALERTRLFENVRESEALFRTLGENIPELLWMADGDGTPIYQNPAWRQYTGQTAEQVSVQGWEINHHPDDMAEARRLWQEATEKGEPFTTELRLRRHDGAYRWFLGRTVPLKAEAGWIWRWIGTLTDIHDRKQAERDASLLANLGQHFARASDPAGLALTVTRAVGEHFGVSRCVLHDVDLGAGLAIITHDYHDGVPSLDGARLPLAEFSAADISALSAGRTVVRRDTLTEPATADQYQRTYLPLGLRALVAVPLQREGRWMGSMWVSHHEPRDWTDAEVGLLRTVAERTWLASENARLNAETQAWNTTLEARVAERTQELREAQKQLRVLSAHAERAREDERVRIAREVHDDLGGGLTVLKMSLNFLRRRREGDSELTAALRDLMGEVDAMVVAVRRIASDLRPPLLDDLGLLAALKWQAQEFEKRTQILCQVTLPELEPELDRDTRTAVFRVFQESLTNVARHAQASQIVVSMAPDTGAMLLRVQDDGCGISQEILQAGRSLGLMGMRERMREVLGDVDIVSQPGQGTTVVIRIPMAG